MNTNMTGFRCVFFKYCFLVLWTKVASAMEGLMFNKTVLNRCSVNGTSRCSFRANTKPVVQFKNYSLGDVLNCSEMLLPNGQFDYDILTFPMLRLLSFKAQ